MVRLVGAIAALVLCLLTLSACADDIETWQPPAELGICARTLAVREAIVAQTDRVHSCAFIDADDLRAIRALDLSGRDITALQTGDFEGLGRLRELRLNGNALLALPHGIFDGLPMLRLIHLHDNPGAPFPLQIDLQVGQERDERWLYLRLPLRPPGRVVAHLQSDGLLLTHIAATIDAGGYVGRGVNIERSHTAAGTARVLRAAVDREVEDCGPEACWTGMVLMGQRDAVEIPSLAGDGEPPQRLPTLVLRINAQSFVHDAVVERGVLAGSRRWRYYMFAEQPRGDDMSADCTITSYNIVTSGGGGVGGPNQYDGRCRLATGSGSGTFGYELPAKRIAAIAGQAVASDRRSGDPCLASNNLRIEADAASLGEIERIDAVNADAESRCYCYISVAQDPNRAAPFRFAEGESCVVEVVDGRISATGCQELVWWGGWGFGGIDSPAEARADAALTRPYVAGEEHLKRLAAIAACETLPEVSLRLDEDSFRESPFHYQSVSDEQGLCELSMTAMAPEDALAGGERCAVSARFASASAYGAVPTRQSGHCDQVVHQANWSQPGGRWSEEEQQAFAEQFASQLGSLSDADWQRLREGHFCIDDICTPLPTEQ
ncbi:MAG: leucine-rich repeat domain-containing protein [Chloroflexi bacterium]|nr:leucine-rich repeat domain-containing protein [Chloroflexota bacterium]